MPARKVNYIDFLKIVGKSKRLLRSGWVREKIKDPESIAEHSFRVSVLAMVLSDKLGYALNKDKLIKMALLHDLGELVAGDIVSERGYIFDAKKRDEKEQIEREGIQKIFDEIGEGEEYVAIFDEMVGRTTPEAKVFWQLDKLEMALQALEYEEEQDKNLEEFFKNVELYHLRDQLLKDISAEISKRRRGNKIPMPVPTPEVEP